jgi:hypothetical protein
MLLNPDVAEELRKPFWGTAVLGCSWMRTASLAELGRTKADQFLLSFTGEAFCSVASRPLAQAGAGTA